MTVQAVGGSVNTVRHISAVATEAELPIDVVGLYESLSDKITLLTAVRPNGPYRTEDLDVAGGTPGVLSRLKDSLHLDCLTVNGKTVGENIATVVVKNSEVIRPLDNPISTRPGVAIFRGNMAPEGSIVKLSAVPAELHEFKGPANIFDGEDEAITALGNGKIQRGDVVILRNMGVMGGPGTVFAASFVAALNGAGIAQYVAVVTDCELSGLNRGIVVGQLMPEAAAGGPLAVVRQGETVIIDVDKRRIDVDISALELKQRLSDWQPLQREPDGSWLSQYGQLVQPIAQGAVLGKRKIHNNN